MTLTTADDKTKQKAIVARQLKRTSATLATLDIIHTVKMAANQSTSNETPMKMLSDDQVNVVRRAVLDLDEAQYSAGAAFKTMWLLKEELELDDGQPLSLAIRKLQVARDEAAKGAWSLLTKVGDKLPAESYYECRDRIRRRFEMKLSVTTRQPVEWMSWKQQSSLEHNQPPLRLSTHQLSTQQRSNRQY